MLHVKRSVEIQATAALLSEARPPTAFFASESLIALGTYRVLRRLDLDRQVALVGFDDLLHADLTARGVTVISPDPVAIGRTAARLLFRRIDGDESPPVHSASCGGPQYKEPSIGTVSGVRGRSDPT